MQLLNTEASFATFLGLKVLTHFTCSWEYQFLENVFALYSMMPVIST